MEDEDYTDDEGCDMIAIRFWKFHEDHPWVYDRLRHLALALRMTGIERYSMAGLYEALRHETVMGVNKEDGFKLNNNYQALYAREIARNEPILENFFRFRQRRSVTIGTNADSLAPSVDAWDRPTQTQDQSFGDLFG